MKLLALDTATEAVSAALWIDGATRARHAVAPREQARRILPMIEALLAEAGLCPAGLDAVAFGRGPGSFTGVRIAAGVAQGIAFAADQPVVPVSTLAAAGTATARRSPRGSATGLRATAGCAIPLPPTCWRWPCATSTPACALRPNRPYPSICATRSSSYRKNPVSSFPHPADSPEPQ